MIRKRLTASALAATSLTSLAVTGFGAPAAHAASVTPGTGYSGRGFDTCNEPDNATMDDWYAHSPYRAVGVYLGGPSYLCATTHPYTADWVAHQAATGWAMWAIYAGTQPAVLAADPTQVAAKADADAVDAAKQAQTLGFGNGSIIFEDVEKYQQQSTSPLVVAYLKEFASKLALQPGGYKLGLYGASNGAQTAVGDAAADPTLSTALAAVDVANATAYQQNFDATTNDDHLSPALWAHHQRIHQYFLDHNEHYGTSPEISIDSDQLDLNPAVPADPITRYAGTDRVGTAVATSQKLWPTTVAGSQYFGADGRPAAQAAVLSRSDQFADALGGSALAAHVGGPLLLTDTKTLTKATADELTRTLAPGSKVYILGGAAAVSPAVEAAVKALGFDPVREGDTDRYGTAVKIAKAMAADMLDSHGNAAVQRVLLATAKDFPDALAAGTAAGATPDTVLLLTDDKVMPAATAAYLGQLSGQAQGAGPNSATVYPVGGQANAAAKTLTNVPASNLRLNMLVGADRYGTAVAVARQFFGLTGTPHTLGFATGAGWPDALSGGAAMGTLDGPLLLVGTGAVPSATADFLDAGVTHGTGAVDSGIVFGGKAVVGDSVLNSLGDIIGGARTLTGSR